jgi:hypothetical protein
MTAGEKDETMSTATEPSLLPAPLSSLDLALLSQIMQRLGYATA